MSERAHSLWLQRDSACRTCLLPLRIFCRSHALCILGYDAEQLPLPQIIAGCAGCNGSSRIRLDGVRARWFSGCRLSGAYKPSCCMACSWILVRRWLNRSQWLNFVISSLCECRFVAAWSFPHCKLLFPRACCLPFVMLHCLKLESRASIGWIAHKRWDSCFVHSVRAALSLVRSPLSCKLLCE